jgi:hypothetical protein
MSTVINQKKIKDNLYKLKKKKNIYILKKCKMDDELRFNNAYDIAQDAARKGDIEKVKKYLYKQPSRLFINAFFKPLTENNGKALINCYNKTQGLSENIRNLATAIIVGRNLGLDFFEKHVVDNITLRRECVEYWDIEPTREIFDKMAFEWLTSKEILWLEGKFYVFREKWMTRMKQNKPINKELLHPDDFDVYDVYDVENNGNQKIMRNWDKNRILNALQELYDDVDDQVVDCWLVGKVEKEVCMNLVDPKNIDGDNFYEWYRDCISTTGDIEWMKNLTFTKKCIKQMIKDGIGEELRLQKWDEIIFAPNEIGGHIINEFYKKRERRNSI